MREPETEHNCHEVPSLCTSAHHSWLCSSNWSSKLTWHSCKHPHTPPWQLPHPRHWPGLPESPCPESWCCWTGQLHRDPCNRKCLGAQYFVFFHFTDLLSDLFAPPLGFLLLFILSSKLPSVGAWRVGTGILTVSKVTKLRKISAGPPVRLLFLKQKFTIIDSP